MNQTVQITFSSPKYLPRNKMKSLLWTLSSVPLMLFRLEGSFCINIFIIVLRKFQSFFYESIYLGGGFGGSFFSSLSASML